MTAPASLYAQEMARRNLSLPRATGCPRTVEVAEKPKATRKPHPIRAAQMDRRNAELVAWYREGMSLAQVAHLSRTRHGKYARTNIGSLSRLLRGLGVTMREPGYHETVATLKKQIRDLRKRLMLYDPQFAQAKYEEAA